MIFSFPGITFKKNTTYPTRLGIIFKGARIIKTVLFQIARMITSTRIATYSEYSVQSTLPCK